MAQKKTAQQRGMKRAQKVLARSQKNEKVRKTRVLAKLDHLQGENSDQKQ